MIQKPIRRNKKYIKHKKVKQIEIIENKKYKETERRIGSNNKYIKPKTRKNR